MSKFFSYPIKFIPIFKENIWGGKNLQVFLNKKLPQNKKIGESWEISTVGKNISTVANGKYKGVTLLELVNEFKIDLLGEKYKKASEFPLLFKFLDASENLSVQIHPDNNTAKKYENSNSGKSECWHIIHTENKKIILGVNDKIHLNKIKHLI
nr:mannose-6-phosphate isomerase [Candidatus Dependentiae bacterium]